MTDKPRLLIVDDEPNICQLLEVLLQREGYQAASVPNAIDALARLEREDFALVITDLRMPGMDGFEFVGRLKAFRKDLPVVMITGYATVENAVKALRYGIDDYVTKPFNIDELRKVVSRTLQTADMQAENRRLLDSLQKANVELARHKKLLARRVQQTGVELRAARSTLKSHEGQLAVHNLLGEFVATEHDQGRLLRQVLAIVNRHFECRYSSIMLVEGSSLVLRACEGDRGKDMLGARQRLGEGVAGHVALSYEPVLVSDITREPHFRPSGRRAYKTPSFVCVPIVHQGNMLGVVNVGDKLTGASFSEADMQVLAAISNQIAPSVENAALYRALEERCAAVIQTLVTVLEAKDRYTSGHSQRVGEYATALGRAAGASEAEVENLSLASQLHDIGKIAVHDFILKKPGRLTVEERKLFNSHPSIGEHLVQTLDFLDPVRPIIRHHHERMDGGGYPDGLRGDAIPRSVRMLTLADSYDAMTSERPYRPAMSPAEAADEIRRCAGDQFDGELADVFCQEVVLQNGARRAGSDALSGR